VQRYADSSYHITQSHQLLNEVCSLLWVKYRRKGLDAAESDCTLVRRRFLTSRPLLAVWQRLGQKSIKSRAIHSRLHFNYSVNDFQSLPVSLLEDLRNSALALNFTIE